MKGAARYLALCAGIREHLREKVDTQGMGWGVKGRMTSCQTTCMSIPISIGKTRRQEWRQTGS